jgi:hypothetical protein
MSNTVEIVGALVLLVISIAGIAAHFSQGKSPPKSAAERRTELLREQAAQAARQPFKQLSIRIVNWHVMAGGRDHGPLAGAHAELFRGKPAPRHSLAYDVVIGFQGGPGKSTILITFADGSYLERTVDFGMLINEQRTLSEAAAEVARFNALAASATPLEA